MAAVWTGQVKGGGEQHHQQQPVHAFSQWSKNKNEIPKLSYSQQAKRDSTGCEGYAMPDCYPYKQRDAGMPAQMLRGSVTNIASSITNTYNNPSSNIKTFAVGTNSNQAGDEDRQTNMAVDPVYNSSFSKTPKTLFVPWQASKNGKLEWIADRKPAKIQGQRGGGQNFSYYRCKVVWDTVSALAWAGYSAHVAIHWIYKAYGPQKTVTQILNQMLKDCCNGGNPQLRVLLLDIYIYY